MKLVSDLAMKFVTKRDFSNAPLLGLTINPKSPGFKHPNHVHKGYRFEIGTAEHFEDLNDAEKNIVSQLVASLAVVEASDTAAVTKIDAEIAEEKEREKRDKRAKREPWTRAHKLQTAALVVSITAGIIGFAGWYHAAHQSPVYQQQIVLKHETEVLSQYLSKSAVDFDKDEEIRSDFTAHDFPWLKAVTDDLTKQGLSVDNLVKIYNESQRSGTGVTSETLKKMSDELHKLANQLPNAQ